MELLDTTRFPLWVNLTLFGAAAAIVWFAGTRIAYIADKIAERTGLAREILGLLLLGGVTSLPEIAVGTTAALQGTPVLSVNDVLGSAAINVVILAIADAAIGRDALTSRQGSAAVLLQGVLVIVLMAMPVGATLTGDALVLGVGVWCWLMLGFYLGSLWLLTSSQARSMWTPKAVYEPAEARHLAAHSEGHTLERLIALAVAAGLAIFVAGFLLARTGDAIAEQTGLGHGFFGLVVLGFSTSLPEVSTVLAAVRLRRYEMAISDVFGTNLFNVTIIVLVDAVYAGQPVLVEAGRFASFGALLTIVLTALFLTGMIERRDRTILRMGIDSVAVLVTYAAGVLVLYGLR